MFKLTDQKLIDDFTQTQVTVDYLLALIDKYEAKAKTEMPANPHTAFKLCQLERDFKLAKKRLDSLTDLFFSEPKIANEFDVMIRML